MPTCFHFGTKNPLRSHKRLIPRGTNRINKFLINFCIILAAFWRVQLTHFYVQSVDWSVGWSVDWWLGGPGPSRHPRIRPNTPPRLPKDDPETPQDPPDRLQDASKSATTPLQDAPRSPRPPQTPARPPKTPQGSPRLFKKVFKTCQEASKDHKRRGGIFLNGRG